MLQVFKQSLFLLLSFPKKIFCPRIFYPVHNVRYPKDEPFNRISNK